MKRLRSRPLWLWLSLALSVGGCVDELVVGTQRGAIASDALVPEDDAADVAEPDAEADAALEMDAEVDATTTLDAGNRDDSALPDPDSGPILLRDAGSPDSGCGQASCPPPKRLGACYACDVQMPGLVAEKTCPNGLVEVCWHTSDNSCELSCPAVATCRQSSDCDRDEYCFFSKRDCGAAMAGWGPRRPLECPSIGTVICGCDGVTYDTACVAAQAGVPFAEGEAARCR